MHTFAHGNHVFIPANLKTVSQHQIKYDSNAARPSTFLKNGCIIREELFMVWLIIFCSSLAEGRRFQKYLLNKTWFLLCQQLITQHKLFSLWPLWYKLCAPRLVRTLSQSGQRWNTYQSSELKPKNHRRECGVHNSSHTFLIMCKCFISAHTMLKTKVAAPCERNSRSGESLTHYCAVFNSS